MKLKDIIPHTTTKAERVKLRQEFARLKRDRQFQTDIRHLLKRSQRNRCFYCNERITWEDRGSWHIDHRIPIYKGGPNEMCNFVVACKGCNLYKGAHTLLRKVKIERREAWMRSKLPEQKPKYLLLKKPERPDF